MKVMGQGDGNGLIFRGDQEQDMSMLMIPGLVLLLVLVAIFGVVIMMVLRRRHLPCPSCGWRDVGKDGRCRKCGRKQGEGFEVITHQDTSEK